MQKGNTERFTTSSTEGSRGPRASFHFILISDSLLSLRRIAASKGRGKEEMESSLLHHVRLQHGDEISSTRPLAGIGVEERLQSSRRGGKKTKHGVPPSIEEKPCSGAALVLAAATLALYASCIVSLCACVLLEPEPFRNDRKAASSSRSAPRASHSGSTRPRAHAPLPCCSRQWRPAEGWPQSIRGRCSSLTDSAMCRSCHSRRISHAQELRSWALEQTVAATDMTRKSRDECLHSHPDPESE